MLTRSDYGHNSQRSCISVGATKVKSTFNRDHTHTHTPTFGISHDAVLSPKWCGHANGSAIHLRTGYAPSPEVSCGQIWIRRGTPNNSNLMEEPGLCLASGAHDACKTLLKRDVLSRLRLLHGTSAGNRAINRRSAVPL